jgi:hypothetical protein
MASQTDKEKEQGGAGSAPYLQVPASLEAAFQRTQTFSSLGAANPSLAPGDLEGYAKEETAFGRIDIDEHGLTAGMRFRLLQPTRETLSSWRMARAPFDQLLAPHIGKIESIDKLDDEVADLKSRSESEELQLERTLEADTKYSQIKERYDNAESRYKQKFAENDQRVPIVWGYKLTYILAIACTGIAEWFINYDVFLRFLQVPAWAAATAIILGALLAFAAHGHGTLLKQWAYRFGPARTRAQRFTDWRFLALSTFGLLIVLTAAGGSRYAAVMRLIGNAPSINLLGAEAEIDINPLRDVLISLLGNLGAWVVGVFFAYVGHDPDPEYMEAAHEREKARSLYNRYRKDLDAEKETIRARYARDITKKQNAAQTFLRDFERLRSLLLQVREHENVIVADLQSALLSNTQRYRDALIQLAIQRQGQFSLIRATDGQAITPYEYQNSVISIGADFVRGLS